MLSTQQQQNNQPTQANNNPPGSTTSKKATGTVTKILENFGFIDDSIFFSLSVVKGNTQVKVGDKVYFECTYSKNLPFNWNATIVQLISSNSLNNQPVHQQPTLHHQQSSSAMHHHQQQQQQQRQPQPSQIHNLSHTQPPHLAPPSQGISLQQQQHPYQQQLQSVVASTVAQPQSAPLNPSQQPLHNPNMYQHQQTQQGAGPNPGPTGYHPGYPIQQQQNKQVPQYGGHQPTATNQPQPMFNPTSYPQHGGNVVGSANQPQQQQQQPPQSVAQPQAATAPQTHVDMVKIQQAVAAAAQLSQFYSPTVAGQQPGRPDTSVLNQQQHAGGSQITAGSNHHQYGGPTGGSGGGGGVGQIQYTSTPGSAFIGSQYNPAASVPVTSVSGGAQIPKKPTPGSGIGAGGHGPSNRGTGGRWDHPRDDSSAHHRFDQGGQAKIRPVGGIQTRDDPRTAGSRFSGKSRFNDSDSRFAPASTMKNEDRFNQNQPVYHSPAQDHFRGNNVGTRMGGGDLRKDQESRFNRDKERDFRDRSRDRDSINANKTMERDKDRPMGRDRRERDRPNRLPNKKRSLSPSPSVASSTGTAPFTASSKSLGLNYLPKRHYEPCNIPKSTLVKNRYNSLELKSKIDSSVHIPSDLKEVFYNVDFNLDLLDVPKPLSYKIIIEKDTKKDEKDLKSSTKKSSTSVETPAKTEPEEKIKPKLEEKKQQEEPPSEEPVKNKDEVEIKAEKQEVKVESQVAVEDKIQNDESSINKTEEKIDLKDEANQEIKEQETLLLQEEKEEVKEENMEKKDEETNDIDSKESQPEEKPEDVENSKSATEVKSEKTETEVSAPPPTVTTSTTAVIFEKEKGPQSQSESHSRGKSSHHGSNSSTNKPANHKFNVKVLLISLPSMAEIYERLFGAEFASVASYSPNSSANQISNRNQVSHFHKLFSMLVSRNSNDGYSFIGGKFIKELDGYLPGSGNEPNLVRTSIRIVWEQIGLNLSSCRQWSVISTFVYNRDNSLNPNECGYEITKIYFPDIWSALDSIYQQPQWMVSNSDQTPAKQCESQPPSAEQPEETKMEIVNDEELKTNGNEGNDSGNQVQSSSTMGREDLVYIKDVPNAEKKKYLQNVLETINNYKVYELKNELENMGIKFESRGKKEQLYQQLQKVVQDSLKILDGIEPVDITIGNDEQIMMSQEDSMTVEGEESQIETQADNGNSPVATKRKLDQDKSPDQKEKQEIEEKNKESSNKKPKLNEENVANSKNDDKLNGPALASEIKVKGNNLTLVSLHTALDPHRFDQFELSVVSEFIRDSLTMHFVQYIYSSLVNQVKLQKPIVPSTSTTETRNSTAANYCHLAFSYFDKGHCGYMPSDDLNILLNMAGFPISKKCFNSLVSSLMSLANITVSASSSTILNERIVYIFFQEPSTLIPRQVIYPTMAGQLSSSSGFRTMSDGGGGGDQGQLVVERNGIQYNIEELIKQSVADQKLKVRLSDSLADCTKKIAQLENQITELDNKQRKMSAATGRQNDELCAVKRERDQIKTKYEQIKMYWLKATMGFNTLMKTVDKTSTGGSQQNEDPVDQSPSKKSSGPETGNAPNPGAVEPITNEKNT